MDDVDYDVVPSNRGGATQIYHLNLLKAWREAETAFLLSLVRNKLELPNSTIPNSLHYDDHLTQAQRAAVAALRKPFADVYPP